MPPSAYCDMPNALGSSTHSMASTHTARYHAWSAGEEVVRREGSLPKRIRSSGFRPEAATRGRHEPRDSQYR